MARAADLAVDVRIDLAQLDAYRRDGWALVRGVVPPEAAEAVRRRIDEIGDELVPNPDQLAAGQNFVGAGRHRAQHLTHDDPERDPLVASVIFSPAVVAVAKAFLGVDAVRHVRSVVLKKEPEAEGGSATYLHQDLCYLPFDRTGSATIWVALGEVTPAMGPLVFVTGSHRMGPLGRDALVASAVDRLHERVVEERWETTSPHHLRPGDATVHDDLTVHGAPPNATAGDRWALAMTFMRPDVLFTGAPWRRVSGLELRPGEPFDHARFPLLR